VDLASAVVSDFAIIMAIAAAVTFLFYKIKRPLILGYLIAGVIIGPYPPPFSLVSGLDVLEAAALTMYVYPYRYIEFASFHTGEVLVMALRNGLLVTAAAFIAWGMRQKQPENE